jgi:Cu/Ag efflux pump CusA
VLKGILRFGLTRRPIVLLGLLVFLGAGIIAFTKLNIEAYPNPAPVILEITAQAPGLSAEEMERYYTIPMEIGLYPTAGIDNIRSTSFYGLSFVRVTFKYGVDYYAALVQTGLNLQQNVTLPQNQIPQIQMSSTVGEIYRYQVVGPPHFGLTNLRTVQTWIATRRIFSVPGVVQINPWGGPTKEYNVDVDLHKLDAYSVTIPQIITALSNANKAAGMHATDAMFHAATQRMRPMLMTAMSACIGLFPAAVSTAIGSQVQRPLATVVVGGLLIGPIMLLVVVPALRMMFLGRERDPEATNPAGSGELAPAE